MTQLAFYCGWPKAWSAFPLIAEVYGEEDKTLPALALFPAAAVGENPLEAGNPRETRDFASLYLQGEVFRELGSKQTGLVGFLPCALFNNLLGGFRRLLAGEQHQQPRTYQCRDGSESHYSTLIIVCSGR